MAEQDRCHCLPTPLGHIIMWLTMLLYGALFTWGAFGPLQPHKSQVLAAWVQAIGALIAIGVAIAAPIWHAKRTQVERDRHALWLITALAARVADGFDQLVATARFEAEVGGFEWFDTGITRDLQATLDSVAITNLPDDRLVYPIVALREILRAGLVLSDSLKRPSSRARSIDLNDAVKLCKRAADEYDKIAEVFHERCGPFERTGYSPLPPGPHNVPAN